MEFLVRLSKGRLRIGKPGTVRGPRLWLVWGRSRGPVCDCCGLLQGPLYDLFECVITLLRVTCFDVNMCTPTY